MSRVVSRIATFGNPQIISPLRAFAAFLLAVPCLQFFAIAQAAQTQAAGSSSSIMRQHYEAAFRFQSAGKTSQADAEYKLYLATVLHHIANGRANLGDYAHAATLYEEALKLQPDNPDVEMDFASAALDALDWIRAETLTSSLLDSRQRNGQAPDAHQLDQLAQAELELGKHQEAIEHFKLAAQLKPGMDSSSKLAAAYLVLGNKSSAAKILDHLPEKFGDTATLRMQLGSLYGGAKFFDSAVEEFNKAIAMDSHLKGAHYSLGATYMMLWGELGYGKAEAEFRKELAIDPDNTLVYMPLGRIAMSQHRLAEAEGDLKRASEADPQNAGDCLALGQFYKEVGKDMDAERAFRKSIALTLDPSRNGYEVEQAHFWLGRILMENGHTLEGHRELDISRNLLYLKEQQVQSRLAGKSMLQMPLEKTHTASPAQLATLKTFEKQSAPVIASSYNNLAVNAANSGDFAAASRNFELAATWNPSLDGIDVNWGRAAFAARNYDKAVKPLSRALESHPDDVGARALLGLSLFMVHEYPKALDVLRPIESNQATGSPINIAWEGSTAMTGDPGKGLARLKELEAASPEMPVVHYLLGVAYGKAGDYSQSESELNDALKLDPSNRDAMTALAQADLALGEKTEALDIYSALAQPGSLDGEAFHQLARLQVELGMWNAAIATLETAIRLNPMDASYHAELADAYRGGAQPDEAEAEAIASETLRAESEFSRISATLVSERNIPSATPLKVQAN